MATIAWVVLVLLFIIISLVGLILLIIGVVLGVKWNRKTHMHQAAGEIMFKKMRRNNFIIVLYLLSAIILAGCAPKTFVELLSRNDNDISRDGMVYVQYY